MNTIEVKINYNGRVGIPFAELDIGTSYVTAREPHTPCIKTGENTCIYYYDDMWDKSTEGDYTEVYPIEAKIEFFGMEREER